MASLTGFGTGKYGNPSKGVSGLSGGGKHQNFYRDFPVSGGLARS
jgi:hypothetical protein